MYAKLLYNGGFPTGAAATIISDLVKVLTGETNVANLSGSVSQSGSFVDVSARAAGWTVHDAAAGSFGQQVIKAPVADNGSQYKYVHFYSSNGNMIQVRLYEGWNATTHAGTNQAYLGSTTSSMLIDNNGNSTTALAIHVSASARHFAFTQHAGGLTIAYPMRGVFEHTRATWNDTVANGYLPAVCAGPTNTFSASILSNVSGGGATELVSFTSCRFLNNYASAASPTDLTGNVAIGCLMLPWGSQVAVGSNLSSVSTAGQNSSSVLCTQWAAGNFVNALFSQDASQKVYPLVPFGVANAYYFWAGGDISNYADIWITYGQAGTAFDVYQVNGNNYVLWTFDTSPLLVRKG